MTTENTKRQKLDGVLIGTHSGTFHADEALAVNLLRSLDRFKSSRLVRTRDPAILEGCDIVVDVGGQYDPDRHRYDHHQRGFEETYSPDFRTKLSSAGLVYKHFGAEIVSNHLGLEPNDPNLPILVAKLYKVFIEAIDGIDNGITQSEAVSETGVLPQGITVKPKYYDGTGLSNRVSYLNPAWNDVTTSETLDTQFEKASALAGSEFFARLDYFAKSWLPGRQLVIDALADRFNNQALDPEGRILIFSTFCPWKEHLHQLEREQKLTETKLPLYVLYSDESQKWRIQAVPKLPTGFESRKPLPEAWRGLRDSELSELIGIPGCIFVHASGFIGGHETFEGALEMAKKAISL